MPRDDGLAEPALGDGAGGIGVVPAELVLPEALELGAVDQHIRHALTSLLPSEPVSSARHSGPSWSSEWDAAGGPAQRLQRALRLSGTARRTGVASATIRFYRLPPGAGAPVRAHAPIDQEAPASRNTSAAACAAARGCPTAVDARIARLRLAVVRRRGRDHRHRRRRAAHRVRARLPHLAAVHARSRSSRPTSMGIHGVIEFGNRMMTGVVGILALVLLVLVLRMRRERRDLFLLALVVRRRASRQAIIGGITVLTGLTPSSSGFHYFASLVLVCVARGVPRAHATARAGPARARRAALVRGAHATRPRCASSSRSSFGILTTGSGPHAGDARAGRNGFDAELMQHVHAWPGLRAARPDARAAVAAWRSRALAVRRWIARPARRRARADRRRPLAGAHGLPSSPSASTWCSPRSSPPAMTRRRAAQRSARSRAPTRCSEPTRQPAASAQHGD